MSHSGHPGTPGDPGRDRITDLINLPPEQRVVAVIDHAFGGVHHVRNLRKHTESKYPYWSCSFYAPICNWDFDNLTRLVVASLEYGVRIELAGGGPNKMKLQLFPRYTRDGAIHDRIPRLEDFATDFDYDNRLANAS